ERDRHAVQTRLHDARLPRMKTLEEFDFNQAPHIPAAKIRELAEGGYIERAEPVVLMGECGTGKTHLATNLPFSEWTLVFPNPRLCKALLDRITVCAHIIDTGTDSYRFRRTREVRKKKGTRGGDAVVT